MKKQIIETRKITVNLPVSLIEPFVREKANLTETIKEALTMYKQNRAIQEFKDSRGKFKFLLSAEELKELRD